MCKCSGKCKCNITTITKGEKGDSGVASISVFDLITASDTSSEVSINLSSSPQVICPLTVAVDGDYIFNFTAHITGSGSVDIASTMYKNGVAALVPSYVHRSDLDGSQLIHAHQCKLTGLVAGDVVGFYCSSTGDTLVNAETFYLKK